MLVALADLDVVLNSQVVEYHQGAALPGKERLVLYGSLH